MATMRVVTIMAAAEDDDCTWDEADELSLYRKTTANVVRRYFRISVELGRLPAPLGKGLGFLRARSSDYKLSSFEDGMIFVCDVERCIKRLDPFEQALLQRIVMQNYTLEETAKLMHCVMRTVVRRYDDGLDRLSAMFLGNGMLKSSC
ncbi:MAG: hypothetical protein ABI383_08200 [Acidobacteriaceae bacterium]